MNHWLMKETCRMKSFLGRRGFLQGVLLVHGRLMTLPFACESGPLGSCALAITDRAAC